MTQVPRRRPASSVPTVPGARSEGGTTGRAGLDPPASGTATLSPPWETGADAPGPGRSSGPVGPQPTGPVDRLPVPPPAAARTARGERPRRSRPGVAVHRVGGRALGLGTVAGAMGLLQLGLVRGSGAARLWTAVPSWAVFATVMVGIAAVPHLVRGRAAGLSGRGVWQVGAAGTVGFAAFWVLVVLPGVASDRGFVLTMALALLGGAVWWAPGRTR